MARWYPAYDDPGRGAFVADQVRALTAAGAHVTVASFEPAFARGKPESRPDRIRAAVDAWAAALARPDALNAPRSWGVSGVEVARLPVVLDPADRSDGAEVASHAAALVAFGTALAARDGVDAIHAHTAIPDGLASARLADRLGVPLVVTEHDSTLRARLDDPEVVALYRSLPGPRRRLVAVSVRLAALLADRLSIPRDDIAVVPNAVPVDVFTPEAGDAEPGGSEGGRDPDELLYVGARTEAKGTEVLLRAFALARERRPALRLRCVGRAATPEDDERWAALATELGIAAAVDLGRPLDRPDVAAAMRRAGLLVLASPYETFGMVVAEALACGLPVAATRSGVEAILGDDGTLGEVAAGTDAGSLADAIDRALARRTTFDPAVLRDRVVRDFSAPAVAARTLALYDAAAEDAPDAGSGRPTAPGAEGADAAEAAGGRGTAEPGSATAHPPAAGRRAAPLLVSFNRTAAMRAIARLPGSAAARAVVVTVPPTPQAPGPLPATGTWLEYDPVAEYKARLAELTTPQDAGAFTRLRAAASASSRHREREELVRDREAWVEAAGRRTFERARDAADGDVGLTWVAVEADDVTAGRALTDLGVPLAPGSLRWLADREDAAGDPSTTPRDR